MKNKFYSVVRIFVECSKENAQEILNEIVKKFEPRVSNQNIDEYYKFKGTYEIWFWVEQNDITPNDALKQVCDALGENWEFHFMEDENDYTSFALWDEFRGNVLINDKVFFANIETGY